MIKFFVNFCAFSQYRFWPFFPIYNISGDKGSNGNKKAEKENDEIIGKWVCEMDMTDAFDLDVDAEIIAEFFMEFNDKGVVEVGIDYDAFAKSLENYMDKYIEQNNLSKSDIEDELGMSLEDFVKEGAKEASGTEVVKYSIKNDVITIDGDKCDFEIDGDELTIDLGDELGEMLLEKE